MLSLSALAAEIISLWNLLIWSLNGVIHFFLDHVSALTSTLCGEDESGCRQRVLFPIFISLSYQSCVFVGHFLRGCSCQTTLTKPLTVSRIKQEERKPTFIGRDTVAVLNRRGAYSKSCWEEPCMNPHSTPVKHLPRGCRQQDSGCSARLAGSTALIGALGFPKQPPTLQAPRCLCKRPVPATFPVRLLPLPCVRVCHCNACVSSPESTSEESWKATSQIVTEEVPFFCPWSWWHWWPHLTDQTIEWPPLPSVLTSTRHKLAHQHLP